jgi:hypothetical protein
MLSLLIPTMLLTAQSAPRSVTLTWSDNQAAVRHSIYRATGLCAGAPAFGLLASGIVPDAFTDSTVQPGNYCYQVTTVNPLAVPTESAPSNAVLAVVPPVTPPPPPTCPVSDSVTWQPVAFTSQTMPFTVLYTATPSAVATDAVLGLSNGAATDYPSMAAIVRFAPSGNIDVRNGAAYAANVAFPYAPGINYHVRLVVDPSKHLYDAYVTAPTGPEIKIASAFAFRSEQAGALALNSWSIHSNTPTSGSITVCNFVVGIAPPPPPPPLPTITGYTCVGGSCTVNLSGPAPTGGMIVTVSLASGAATATLPVAILAGSRTGSFQIR